jgi:hemolysin III
VSKTSPDKQHHIETAAEETASVVTHAVGVLLAAVGLVMLVIYATFAHDPRRIVAVSIYGASLVLMYSASSLYHLANHPRLKRRLRVLDHASIYLLIAGTYTPILLISIRGGWGWGLFGVVWGMACTGVILKLFFIERFALLSTAIYIAMGWMVLVAAGPLFAHVPHGGIAWLFAGGIIYTGGVIFYLWDHLPFNHAIWHLFVIGGSVCHFLAVLFYILPVVG